MGNLRAQNGSTPTAQLIRNRSRGRRAEGNLGSTSAPTASLTRNEELMKHEISRLSPVFVGSRYAGCTLRIDVKAPRGGTQGSLVRRDWGCGEGEAIPSTQTTPSKRLSFHNLTVHPAAPLAGSRPAWGGLCPGSIELC
jgi:hypothetical protein